MFRSQSNFFRSSKKEKNHADEKEDIENQQTSDTECHSNFKVNISHENKHQDIIIENPDEINQSPALLPAVGAYILASADMLVETLQDLRIMDPEGTLLDEVESEENIQDTEKNEDLHGRPINEVLKDELPVSTGSSHDSHQLLYPIFDSIKQFFPKKASENQPYTQFITYRELKGNLLDVTYTPEDKKLITDILAKNKETRETMKIKTNKEIENIKIEEKIERDNISLKIGQEERKLLERQKIRYLGKRQTDDNTLYHSDEYDETLIALILALTLDLKILDYHICLMFFKRILTCIIHF